MPKTGLPLLITYLTPPSAACLSYGGPPASAYSIVTALPSTSVSSLGIEASSASEARRPTLLSTMAGSPRLPSR